MARITENPKVIAAGLLVAVGVAGYLHGPTLLRQITAVPSRPVVPPLAPIEGGSTHFYRISPKQLPDRWQESLQAELRKSIFDETPKKAGPQAPEDGLPPIPASWRLTGVWLSPESKAAMVSGIFVEEDEILGAFRVTRIERDKVVLAHPKGERILLLESGAQIATPGPGDSPEKANSPPLPAGLSPEAKIGREKWMKNQKGAEQFRKTEENRSQSP